jgi:hypothetical protein
VYQYAQSEVEDQRELAFILLHELAETLGASFQQHYTSLKHIYQVALQDPSSKVRPCFGVRSSQAPYVCTPVR